MTDLFSWSKSNTYSRQDPEEIQDRPSISRANLSREQVVDQIISINSSATAEYLAQFEERSLNTYLDHLISSQQPRGPHARWDRPGDAPSMMVRRRVV